MIYFGNMCTAQVEQGDCRQLMEKVPAASVDFIFADLPYGTTDVKGDNMIPPEELWQHYKRILTPGGCLALFASQPFTTIMAASNLPWLKYALVWDKNKCGSPGLAKVRPMKTHEDVLIFAPGRTVYNPQMQEGEPYARKSRKPEGYVGKANNHGYGLKPRTEFSNDGTRYPQSILRFPRDFSAQQQVHPHQKPLSLCRWFIETYTHPGQMVLDNTMGSAPAGEACMELGRNFRGMELLADRFEVACNRLADAQARLLSLPLPGACAIA